MTALDMMSIQRDLSQSQSIPVVGPICISPIKAVVSIAQIIAGLAGTILFGPIAYFTHNNELALLSVHSFLYLGTGIIGLLYSVTNMLTLGILGLSIERKMEDRRTANHREIIIEHRLI